MFMRKNGLTVISYKDHLVQIPLHTKETTSYKNTGVTSYKDHFVQRRPLRTKTQEFCVQVFLKI